MSLDLIPTVAFAGLLLFVGYAIRRAVTPLARYNIDFTNALIITAFLNLCR